MSLSVKQKNIIVTIAVPLVLLAGFIAWVTWVGDTKDIESVANQFKPDSSWKLVEHTARPPQNICLSDSACPSLRRAWELPTPIQNEAAFEKIAQIDDSKMVINEKCFYKGPSETVASKLCSATLVKNGYDIELYYSGYDTPARLVLSID